MKYKESQSYGGRYLKPSDCNKNLDLVWKISNSEALVVIIELNSDSYINKIINSFFLSRTKEAYVFFIGPYIS